MRREPKPHHVVIEGKKHPLKQWLRDHPEFVPGVDPLDRKSTSHKLREALVKQGWKLDERSDQVLLIKPNDRGESSSYSKQDVSLNDSEAADAKGITFGLERDLQQALRGNIGQLEPGLTIVDNGGERTTEAGRIDITARDGSGRLVAVELKAGTARPDAVTQLAAYMGALAESGEKGARGILVAGEFHRNIVLAARAIPDLTLRKYTVEFRFEKIE